MSALVSTVSNVLKFRYLSPLQSQLHNEILVTQLLDLDSKNIDLDGLKGVIGLHHGRSTGIGARLEDENLPAAGSQKYNKLEYDLAYLYGRARFSGQAVQKTKTDAGSFIRVVTEELDRLRDDLALDTARQYYGDGSGAIATIPAGVISATQTLADNSALNRGFLYPGMIVDVGTLANPRASADSAVISDVDVAAGTVTFSASFTSVSGDRIFREDNAAAASVSKEINAGLQAILSTVNTTVVGTLAASSAGNSYWDNQRDTTGGAISLSSLMQNWNKIHARGAKAPEVVVLTTPGLVRRLFESTDFQGKVQHVNTQDLKGGFQSVAFNAGSGNMTIAPDRLAPRGRVNFIHKKHIKVFSPGDWDFLQRDGLTIRWVDNRDAFQAVLFRYVNLGADRRNTSLVMSGLTDTDF